MINQTKTLKASIATAVLFSLGYLTYSPMLIPVMTLSIAGTAFAISAAYVGVAYSLYLAAQSLIHLLYKDSQRPNLPLIVQSKVLESVASPPLNNLTNSPNVTPPPPTPLSQDSPGTAERVRAFTRLKSVERIAARREEILAALEKARMMPASAEPGINTPPSSPTQARSENIFSSLQEADQQLSSPTVGISTGDDDFENSTPVSSPRRRSNQSASVSTPSSSPSRRQSLNWLQQLNNSPTYWDVPEVNELIPGGTKPVYNKSLKKQIRTSTREKFQPDRLSPSPTRR